MIGGVAAGTMMAGAAAGLSAVFIPHAATWDLEKCELESGGGKLLILTSFRELRTHF